MKVLIFTAVWCPSCILMKLRWEKISPVYPWLETINYDYDLDAEMVKKYNISKDIPVFIFLNETGDEFRRLTGETDKKDLIKLIEENQNK
ncbi:MAG: thioredoxin family protein [Candidatus Buchananbacteria bacterium]